MSRGPSPEVRFAIDDLYVDYLWALDTQHIDRYVAAFEAFASDVSSG